MNYKKAYEDLKKKHEDLIEEFDKWKNESIKWSVEDFTMLKKDGWQISEEQAQEALDDMIRHHDCNLGITWDTLDYYIEKYGEQVEEGKEAWRKYYEE